MRKLLYTLTTLAFLMPAALRSQVCNVSGNLMIFTNYDGGTLTINVNQNITNLKIGVCSYEGTAIFLTGPFVANVTEVRYAGYNGSNNHCGTSINTSINGAPGSATTSINIMPAVTLSNPNGYSSIICGYSCSNNTNQGGCNTIDQIEAYFLSSIPQSTLFAHKVQYGCWTGTQSVSAGGTCCPPPPLFPGSVSASQTVCAGDTPAAFTSSTAASGGTGSITYTWQASTTSSTSGFSNISGANSTTYQVSSPSTTTYYRRAASTPSNSTVYSNVIAVTVLSNPAVNVYSSGAFCAGGSVSLLPLPPISSASFSWSGPSAYSSSSQTAQLVGLTSSHLGTYTLTVTYSNSCMRSGTVALPIVYQNPTLSISQSTSICNGAAATLTVTGANSYTWLPGNAPFPLINVTPAATTIYTVTGKTNVGCYDTRTVMVTVNALPTVFATANPTAVCSGVQAATLSASGAMTYSWTPGLQSGSTVTVSPLSTSAYTVTGFDANGCSDTYTVPVIAYPLPTVAIIASTLQGCNGSTFTLSAQGAASLQWEPGSLSGSMVAVTPTVTTVYIVTGTDANGCSSQKLTTVVIFPLPVLTFTSRYQTTCPKQSNTITVTGAATYSWHSATNPASTSIVVNPSVTTTYSVTGTAANSCIKTATTLATVVACLTAGEASGENNFSMFPNPSNGEVTFTSGCESLVRVADATGKVIRELLVGGRHGDSANIQLLPGVYLVHVSSSSGLRSGKLVIE